MLSLLTALLAASLQLTTQEDFDDGQSMGGFGGDDFGFEDDMLADVGQPPRGNDR